MPRPIRRPLGLVLALALLAAACGSDDESASAPATAGESPPAPDRAEPPDTDPAVTAGEITGGWVEIDGVEVDYVTAVPAGFEIGSTAPVLLAFPPGGQDPGLTRRLVEQTYGPEARRLGWVVVSPAAPGGELFFLGGEAVLPGFVDWLETWVEPEGGAPHVAGVSNGGLSSFRYAAQNPDRLLSLVAFPGFARSDDDVAAMAAYAAVPIRLFAGGDDTPWIDGGERTVEAFEAVGGDIELRIFPGEGHVMSSTADGVVLFEQLESFRTSG